MKENVFPNDVYGIIDNEETEIVFAEADIETENIIDFEEAMTKMLNEVNEKANVKISEKEKENIEIKEMMEKYNTGDPELQKEATTYMINKLANFVRSIRNRTFGTYTKHYQDLFQEGCLGIMKAMPNYNPERSRPTTYFKIYIVHEMTKFIDTEVNHTSSHYSSNIAKISKVIDIYEQKGIRWTEQDLAIETGLTLETITQCLLIKERSNEVHYETDAELEKDLSERIKSPEDALLEKEKDTAIHKAVLALPDEERLVVCSRMGLQGYTPSSFKETAERLGIPVDKVRKLYYKAIRHLRSSTYLKHIHHDYLQETESRTVQSTEIPLIPKATANETMDILEEIPLDEEEGSC